MVNICGKFHLYLFTKYGCIVSCEISVMDRRITDRQLPDSQTNDW